MANPASELAIRAWQIQKKTGTLPLWFQIKRLLYFLGLRSEELQDFFSLVIPICGVRDIVIKDGVTVTS